MPANGGELLAQSLARAGVGEVFTLHGGHLDAFFVACESAGLRLTDTRHEATADHAADAYDRMTGRPGVCVVTSGPGFTNACTAMANAYLDSVPVVFVVGAPPLRETETNPLQGGFDQIAVAAPVTKWAHRITHAERIPELVSLAFRKALSGRPGPVLLEVPIDVMFTPVDESRVRFPSPTAYDAPALPAPSAQTVEAVLGLLADARYPVLVAGGGAALSRCGTELLAFAERVGLPVFTPNKGDGLVPSGHRLYGGGAVALLPQVTGVTPDVVILLGTRTGMFTGGRASSFPGASLVQIDADAAEIGRLYDVAVPVVADCREALEAFTAAAAGRTWPDRTEWIKAATSARHSHAALFTDPSTASGRLHPYFAAKAVM